MLAKCLIFACLLCLPVRAQEKPWWADREETKRARATMEKQLFPLLQEADEVVLYSLYPLHRENLRGWVLPAEDEVSAEKRVLALALKAEDFEHYPILGKVEIKGEGEPAKLLDELRAAMLTTEESRMVGMCFEPRHGILVRKGEQRLRFVNCFHCKRTHLLGLPEEVEKSAGEVFMHFKGEFEANLNSRLDAAKVVRSPPREEPPAAGK
jgi:hypothetical protein